MKYSIYQKQNPEFLNNYLNYKRCIEHCSNTTVREDYFDIRTFFRYLKLKEQNPKEFNIDDFKQLSIKDITIDDMNNLIEKDIDNFLFFLRYELNNTPKTRNKKLASLRGLFKFLTVNNHINNDPTRNHKSTNTGKRLPKYLNLSQSKTMLSKIITSEQRNKIRNYAIVCVFLNCGIRLSELVNIDLTDIKFDERTLKVCGKGNKERMLYLNDATNEAISKYLEVRPKLDKSYKDYNALFLSERNKRIARRSVQDIVEKELYLTFNDKEAGFHTHTLRHTCATLLYNEGNADILIAQKILGHESLASTEIYTHINDVKLKDIMQNYGVSSLIEKENEKNGK